MLAVVVRHRFGTVVPGVGGCAAGIANHRPAVHARSARAPASAATSSTRAAASASCARAACAPGGSASCPGTGDNRNVVGARGQLRRERADLRVRADLRGDAVGAGLALIATHLVARADEWRGAVAVVDALALRRKLADVERGAAVSDRPRLHAERARRAVGADHARRMTETEGADQARGAVAVQRAPSAGSTGGDRNVVGARGQL